MANIKFQYTIISLFILGILSFWFLKNLNLNWKYHIGEEIDSFNGIIVYHNGGVNNDSGRNISKTGYNVGLKYQCVEFVKRYYLEYLKHEMPDSYGHAKSFYDKTLKDNVLNKKRNLIQFSNPSVKRPEINDIIIFDSNIFNKYGHVAIITEVSDSSIEIIQQNSGAFGNSRKKIKIEKGQVKWNILDNSVLGRLRKK